MFEEPFRVLNKGMSRRVAGGGGGGTGVRGFTFQSPATKETFKGGFY
jgi:hypothetical protein